MGHVTSCLPSPLPVFPLQLPPLPFAGPVLATIWFPISLLLCEQAGQLREQTWGLVGGCVQTSTGPELAAWTLVLPWQGGRQGVPLRAVGLS